MRTGRQIAFRRWTGRIAAAAGILAAATALAGSAAAQNRLTVDPHSFYGSIAYSPSDGRWGYSYDYRSEGESVQVALNHCRKSGGRSCRTVLWFRNGCAAVAIAGSNSKFAVKSEIRRDDSEAVARRLCQEAYGRTCTIKVWACTSR